MFEGMENLFPNKPCPDIRMAEIFTDKNMKDFKNLINFYIFSNFLISYSYVVTKTYCRLVLLEISKIRATS
jgi:hypothetical protein